MAVVFVAAAVLSRPGGARAVPAFPVDRVPAVRAKLIADVRRVGVGRAFTVGVLIEMKPGWHVYWKNPGDAGLATEVQWRLPRGFAAGELHWPIPSRFPQPGGIVGYGYDTSVLLWAEITPPRQRPVGGEIRIAASVSWLACKDRCVPGEAELDLKLPAGDKPISDNTELFDRWRGRLPVSRDAARAEVAADVRGRLPAGSKWGTVQLELKWLRDAPRGIDWYPGPADALEIAAPSVKTTGKKR